MKLYNYLGHRPTTKYPSEMRFSGIFSGVKNLYKTAIAFGMALFLAFNAAATDYFVDASKAAANDVASGGLTWETAFKTVPFALSIADNGGDNRVFVKNIV